MRMPGVGRRPELPFVARDNPLLSHQLGHPVFAAGMAPFIPIFTPCVAYDRLNVKLTRIVKVPAFTISVLSGLLARRIFRGFLTQFMLWGIMNRHYDNFSVFNQI